MAKVVENFMCQNKYSILKQYSTFCKKNVKLNLKIFILLLSVFLVQCKKEEPTKSDVKNDNSVQYASGFSIEKHEGYTLLEVTNPWPNATKKFKYILKKRVQQFLKKTFKTQSSSMFPSKKL